MDPTIALDIPKDTNLIEIIRLGGVLTGLAVLVITWFVVRLVRGTLGRVGHRFAHRRLLINQISTLAGFTIYLTGILLAVSASVSLSREVVIALTGTAAVTVGFALKDLAASILAGVTIILDRPFQVGDRVTFGGTYGEVRSIGLRSVRLITLDDNVVTIPNNKFLTEAVSSWNYGALDMMLQLDFFVGVDQDIALAKQLVQESLTTNRYVYLKKPWMIVVNQVVHENYFAVRLRAKAHVLDVKYEQEFQTDVTERVLEAFRAHGVLPPALLHREVTDVAPKRRRVPGKDGPIGQVPAA
ncbi:mechanosensitive ion channel family protein [Chondromyces crocatus]|uniref:Potassium transporter KefA n=1 Tax=Chondromyces crocatus TaxID=52 RepID=A0A0K1E819_CHOCO|nr:mechanosensitive ion channel domain-containing protein [Chondromyces crocatus]AKT37004.1 potassium transporter KefA [Chondromyces crocatus]